MPRGLPSNIGATLQEQILFAIDYLEIPSWHQVLTTSQTAYRDTRTALESTGIFLSITLKPLYILFALVARYIYAFLKLVLEHSGANFIKGSKEGIRQAKVAWVWLVKYQRSLSRTAVMMEVGLVVALVVLYSVRRYIIKKQYVTKVMKWYKRKKRAIALRYEKIVERISQTSLVLALLLPHVLYLSAMGILKYFVPSLVRYLSDKTILADVISFYYPLVKTVLVIHRWNGLDVSKNTNKSKSTIEESPKSVMDTLVGKKSTKSKVTDKYLKVVNGTTTSNRTLNESVSRSGNARKKNSKESQEEMEQVVEDLSKLIKYWVVYALLVAIYQFCTLLPIAGSILSNLTKSSTTMKRTYPWTRTGSNWFGKIKPSKESLYECHLFFFIWLLYLPTLQNDNKIFNRKEAGGGTMDVKSRVRSFEKRTGGVPKRNKSKVPFPSKPLDIMYDKLTPFATSLLASSTNLIQTKAIANEGENGGSEDGGPQSTVIKTITWLRSFLDVMVWTRLISERTKNRLVSTLIECSALLPALVTLGMPSYFTQYGIIYISLIVPAASAANSSTMLKKYSTDENMKAVATTGSTINRYLQYWVIYAIFSSIISSFSPILAWLPLSTHMIWVLWAYIQLESTTLWMYHVLECDLVAFGLLHRHAHNKNKNESGVQDAVTMKLINSFLTKIPSTQGLKGQNAEESISELKTGGETGVEGEIVTRPEQQKVESTSSCFIGSCSNADDETTKTTT